MEISPKIIKEWLDKADEDFFFASAALEDELSFFPQICYHYQQAGEKYLKAYIVAYDLEFEKIHDLIKLLEICSAHNPKFSQWEPDCTFLTDFYNDTRYPVQWHHIYSKELADKAKEAAKDLRTFVYDLLRKDGKIS
jgi:HEPN domain-containing protein